MKHGIPVLVGTLLGGQAAWAQWPDCGGAVVGVVNGAFEDSPDLAGWCWEGPISLSVTRDPVGGQGNFIHNRVAVLAEGRSGGLTRIYQDFVLPDSTEWLTFRYRLNIVAGAARSAVPPDALVATLHNTSSIFTYFDPLAPVPSIFGFYYADSDGQEVYDPSPAVTTVSAEDPVSGFRTVRFNWRGYPGLSPGMVVRLEFGFANGDNGISSSVSLDDVSIDCPDGMCCDAATGHMTLLDDDNACTDDYCCTDPQTPATCGPIGEAGPGTAVHSKPTDPPDGINKTCCGECNEVAADVVIMLDLTASTLPVNLETQKAAVRAMLTAFEESNPKPWIALGRFQAGAGILVNLTQSYQSIRDALDAIGGTGGPTNLATAINVAKNHLNAAGNGLGHEGPNYLVLITDGAPNRPEPDEESLCAPATNNPCVGCICDNAQQHAECAALAAREAGVDIFAFMYLGEIHCDTPEQLEEVRTFLRYRIASHPSQFLDASLATTSQVQCLFFDIAELISCDDENPHTVDRCLEGYCIHEYPPRR